MNQQLYVATAGITQDEYGNDVRDWAHATIVGVLGLVQQTQSVEVTLDRDTVIADWLLFLPASTTIDARARISDGTNTWEVIGNPNVVRTPRGPHHIECRLVSIEG